MAGRRPFLLLLGLLMVSSGFVWSAASNANGAPETSAKDGCTCHGMQDSGVTVSLMGLPAAYDAGVAYNLTLSVAGGTQVPAVLNQGGFAIEANAGKFVAGTGSQARSDLFVTHTAQGNDQRSWQFRWTAPSDATVNVTFFYAANAVNGDGASADELDQWNRGTKVVPPNTTAPKATTAPATGGVDDTPSPSSVAVVAAIAVALAVTVRRR